MIKVDYNETETHQSISHRVMKTDFQIKQQKNHSSKAAKLCIDIIFVLLKIKIKPREIHTSLATQKQTLFISPTTKSNFLHSLIR